MREFGAGFGTLLSGFGYWRRIPRAMALGLLPAVVVGLFAVAALAALIAALPALAHALTPFAQDWIPVWAVTVRVAVGAALFGAAVLLIVATFTAVTLAVGDPCYERIWRAVEMDATGGAPESAYGFWRAAGDSIRLIARGALAALFAGVVGFVPVVGGPLGFAVGLMLTGWLLADELTSRALTARGLDRSARRTLLRARRARTMGFGVATQLCFLVPLGAVAVMPAAVAGSTLLSHDLLRAVPAVSASQPPGAAGCDGEGAAAR